MWECLCWGGDTGGGEAYLDMGYMLDIQLKRLVTSQDQEAKNNEGQSLEFSCSSGVKSGGATV